MQNEWWGGGDTDGGEGGGETLEEDWRSTSQGGGGGDDDSHGGVQEEVGVLDRVTLERRKRRCSPRGEAREHSGLIEWRAKGANSTGSIHEDRSPCGECEQQRTRIQWVRPPHRGDSP